VVSNHRPPPCQGGALPLSYVPKYIEYVITRQIIGWQEIVNHAYYNAMKIKKSSEKKINLTLTPEDNARLANLCGQYNQNLQQIEKYLSVKIHNRGPEFQIIGNAENANKAKKILEELYTKTAGNKHISAETIHLELQDIKARTISTNKQQETAEPTTIKISTPKIMITPHTPNQIKYVKNMLQSDINFAIGPAGTGKTYLAVAVAVAALIKEEVERITLVRPVVEAGEHLGFLPGDISQKVDPYLRPLYDALYDMLGAPLVEKFIAEHVIEIAPLAFMRGRTLNAAFIILDESQNTTPEQMKMFLTRMGFNSKAVITGDITQIDLAKGKQSGLIQATKILKNIKEISFSYFESIDVVRHPLIQRIIQAYDKEAKSEKIAAK
jgi:phosphate starvation-inducible protein PhoH and related proteins